MNDKNDRSHARDLAEKSAELTQKAREADFGTPGWRELADEAIGCSRDALAALGTTDPERHTIELRLGLILTLRWISGSNSEDRDEAVGAFEDFLAAPCQLPQSQQSQDRPPQDQAPQDQRDLPRLLLGWLLLYRAMRLPPPQSAGLPDLGRSLLTLMAGFTPAPGAGDDTDRAVELLGRVVASGTIPAPLRKIAVVMHSGAKIVQATMFSTGPADAMTLLSLLSQAVRDIGPGGPFYTEMKGLHAWLNAEQALANPAADPSGSAAQELEEAAGTVAPGHLLYGILQHALGLTIARRAMHTSGENLRKAAEHINRARAEMADWPSHPLYDESLRVQSGILLSATAWEPSPAAIQTTIDLARQLLAAREPSDQAGIARDTYLLGMAHALRVYQDERPEDWAAAASEMHRALSLVAADDPLRAPMLGTYAAVLNDHYQTRGSLADAEASQMMFDQLGEILDGLPDDSFFDAQEVSVLTGIRGVCRVSLGWRMRDLAWLYRGEAEIQRALDGLPPSYILRSRILAGLGTAKIASGLLRSDYLRIQEGVKAMTEAADAMQIDEGGRLGLRAIGALTQLLDGRLRSDDTAVRNGIATLAELANAAEFPDSQRIPILWALGNAHLLRHGLVGTAEDLDFGIARLEQARARVYSDPGNPQAAPLLSALAQAYRDRGEPADLEQATDTGLAALQAQVYDVVLQRDAGHSLVIARGAADQALAVARWLTEDQRNEAAIEALELGRGMVLHAATVNAWATSILRTAGHPELAAEWESAQQSAELDWAADPSDQPRAMAGMLAGILLPVHELPSGLRQRVLSTLHDVGAFGSKLGPPSTDEIVAALRTARADALAYLIPGTTEDSGLLLVLFADGETVSLPAAELRMTPGGPALAFAEAAQSDWEAWRAALESVTGWAWQAAMGPLLHAVERRGLYRHAGWPLPRLVLVPGGPLGAVPWHAAWTGERDRTYACQRAVFTYAASAGQFADAARREWLPLGDDPVFVADPTRSLPGATFQTLALRELLYPGARGYGETGRPGDQEGTPDQVLAHVPGPASRGASLLQFSCHGVSAGTPMTSHLVLAAPESPEPGPDESTAGNLSVRRILQRAYSGRDLSVPCGLVVLAACVSDMTPGDYDEALTLSTAFLAAGAASVVGSRWEVSGLVTPVLMFMFHYFLRRERMTVADALQATQDWMLDPGRAVPPEMPSIIRRGMTTHDCADIAAWAAFTHQGR